MIATIAMLVLGACTPTSTTPPGRQDPPSDDSGQAQALGVPLVGAEDPAPWVELIEDDTETLADVGLVLRTYAVTDAHEPAYTDMEGNPPEFRVVVPADLAEEGEQMPVLLWLHGGVAATPDDPDFGHLCTYDGTVQLAKGTLLESGYLLAWLREHRHMAVMPHSTWCDLWAGLGPDDPVNSDHRSQQHVAAVMEAVTRGLDGARGDRRQVAVWGRSIGAVGTFVSAAELSDRGYGITGIVADSGPFAVAELAGQSELYPEWMASWFGGPPWDDAGDPTEWYENYLRVDPIMLVEAGRVDVPVLVGWNQYDQLANPQHGPMMWEALQARHGVQGLPAFGIDFARHAPGDWNHTQLTGTQLADVTSAAAAVEAMQGRSQVFVEVNAHCETAPDDACALIKTYELSPALRRMVGDDALVTTTADQVLYDQPLDAAVPRDRAVRLRLAMDTPELDADQLGKVLTLELRDADGAVVFASKVLAEDLVVPEEGPPTSDQLYAQVQAVTMTVPVEPLALAETVQIRASGLTRVRLDGLWFSWAGN